MNASRYDDVPARWMRLLQTPSDMSSPSFSHLEVALKQHIGVAPALHEEDSNSRRVMRQPDLIWHQFDPAASSLPAYKAPPSQLNEGATPLVAACIDGDQQAVQALLWESEDVNARDHRGLTALDHAIHCRQFAIAEMLSAAGAVWTQSRNEGTAVLIPAVRANLPNLLRCALSAGADIAVMDGSGRMPLHHAVLSLRHQFVPCLTNAQTMAHADALGNTPLHLAAIVCNPLALRALLDRHAALNTRNREGNTALSCACSLPSANAVMALLRAGADTTLENHVGQRPLHIACLHGQTDIVRMLLALGVDPHVRTAHGETALDIARRSNIPAIVSALMAGGATY